MQNVANEIIEEIGKAQTRMDRAETELRHSSRYNREYWKQQSAFYRGLILGLEKAHTAVSN